MNGHTQIREVREDRSGVMVQTRNNRYAFPWVFGDEVRGGTKADLEGVVTYGGESVAKNYIKSHDLDEVPADVVEAVAEHAVVVDGVTGGWKTWEGRPEFQAR
jgi:hypothetical protein